MWYYRGEQFTSEMIGDYVGFVYLILDKTNNRKYIGKKLFKSKRKLPPLKGKTRKRTVIKESDWQDYFGSSEEVKSLVEQLGRDNFHREILHLCRSKGEMSYLELKEQVDREVLLRDDYYNNIIQVRIHGSHVKNLREDP
jgi:serine/threonine protein kinase